jgi:RND family efflux transporter MFP subunit
LRARNSATAPELDEADARLAAATARVAGAQAGVEQATAGIAVSQASADAAAAVETYTTIRAPFDGVVTERLMDPGNLAAPGTPLLRLDATGARRVEARVDEGRAAFVKSGDPVEILLDGRNAEGEDPILGTVTEVARAVSPDERAFTVTVSLPASETARTGTFARIRFNGAARTALVVPAAALRRQGQITSLFVVQDGKARLRLVQTGTTTQDGVEILAGLDAGERVVVAPPPALDDGRAVTVSAQAAQGRSGQ